MRRGTLAITIALSVSSACGDDLGEEEPGAVTRAGPEELAGGPGRVAPAAEQAPEVLIDDAALASDLRVAGERIYWVAPGGDGYQLRSAAASGGAVTVVAELGPLAPIDLALAGGQVYWTSAGRRGGRLQRLPLDQPGAIPEVLYRDREAAPTALSMGGRFLYLGAADGCVRRLDAAGAVTEVACGEGTPVALAADEAEVFWGTAEGDLYRAPAAGGAAERRIAGESFHGRLFLDESAVYWLNAYARAVQVMEREARSARALAAAQYAPVGLAMDADHLYFTTSSDQSVKRVSKGSSPVEVLAGEQAGPADIALQGVRAFWINEGDGTIMTLAVR